MSVHLALQFNFRCVCVCVTCAHECSAYGEKRKLELQAVVSCLTKMLAMLAARAVSALNCRLGIDWALVMLTTREKT